MKIIGKSEVIKKVNQLITQVALTQANVLISGESGTGKELVACTIHALSNRSDKPFIAVNCAAIPHELLESELFGHEKGAFTGAIAFRQGRFELANHGSIFLDEIGDMPLPMQVKLLRVLQERAFERIGSNKTIETNVRVIAATNHDLEHCIEEGSFREDLYYRLNVFPINIPPLRNRREDIPLLIDFFLKSFNKEMKVNCTLSANANEKLMAYNWPGNVRELANIIERLCILYPDQIVDKNDLPDKIKAYMETKIPQMNETIMVKTQMFEAGFDLKNHMVEMEVSLINQALSETNGVVSKAARILGIKRTTLVEKIKKYKVASNTSNGLW